MDDIVEDTRQEVECLMAAWQSQGQGNGGIFRPRAGDHSRSEDSSDYDSGDASSHREDIPGRSQVRFMVSNFSEGSYRDEGPVEIKRGRASKISNSTSTGTGVTTSSTPGGSFGDV